jgi:hypothetical protein
MLDQGLIDRHKSGSLKPIGPMISFRRRTNLPSFLIVPGTVEM